MMWAGVEAESVHRLPEGIDGLKVYCIKKYSNLEALQDGRKWRKNCPTEWKDHGRTRYADCGGSFKCTNKHCPFKIQYGVINSTQFETKGDDRQICKGCGEEGFFVPCYARRYLCYAGEGVTVYHYGKHTCPVISKRKKAESKNVEQLVRNNPNIKPSEVQSVFVLSAFQEQKDWADVEREAASAIDRKWISNVKEKVKKDIEPHGHNFEAVVSFKEYCDKKDKFFIYKINDRSGNPDQPSYVFKTSSLKLDVALNMDCDGDHFMNSEFCFFDGKRKRCRGFVTLTASVYHPLLRKQITLATMEAESEDQRNVKLFWNLLNECLCKVSCDANRKFNPVGWCTDMAGANLAGLRDVFGEAITARIKTCEFHFKDHRNKNARKLDAESATEFKTLCDNLLLSATEDAYETSKAEFDRFIAAKEERGFLFTWLSWWHQRRGFIFRAFAPSDAPRMNQAEVIHAGWVNRDRPNLSMLDVCQADTRDSLLLDIEMKDYRSGAAPGGKGPSFADQRKNKHAREVSKAKRLGREMFPEEEFGHFIDPGSSYCPRENQRKRQKTKRKQKQQSSQANIAILSTQEHCSNPSSWPLPVPNNSSANAPCGSFFQATPSSSGGLSAAYNAPVGSFLHSTTATTPSFPLPVSNNSSANAPCGSFFQDTPSSSGGLYAACNASSGSFLHSTTATMTPSLPSISFSNSPYGPPQPVALHHIPGITQQGDFIHSSHNSPVGYFAQSIPSGSSILPFGALHQGFTLQHQTTSVVPRHADGTFATWHSGMSPHKYEVVVLKPAVKNCYGCGSSFVEKYRRAPFNLVVKHVDRRVTGKDDRTGQLIYSRDFSNTYYHLMKSHIQRKNPDFTGVVYISTNLYLSGLDEEQRTLLQSCDLQLLIQ